MCKEKKKIEIISLKVFYTNVLERNIGNVFLLISRADTGKEFMLPRSDHRCHQTSAKLYGKQGKKCHLEMDLMVYGCRKLYILVRTFV